MKAYLIALVDVTDPEHYEAYRSRTRAIIESFGGHFIVRGGRMDPLEGDLPFSRVIVVEFPTMADARAFYDSEEYQQIIPLRTANSNGQLFLVEGSE